LAAAVADLFIESEVALMEWKGETIKAKAKAQAIPGPLVVLVNRATRGAAEVLAAILREQRTAILIGGPTAGQAVEMTEFKLKTGQTLLVATAAVKLGGGNRLSAGGIQPDISVQVAQDEELAYWENPYKQFGSGINLAASTATAATNRLAKPRLNEAELVRLKRQGLDPETELDARPTWLAEPPRQLVNDPALARGLDLLKGLSLLKSSRPL